MTGVHVEERLFESYQLGGHYRSMGCTADRDGRVVFVCDHTLTVRRQQVAAS